MQLIFLVDHNCALPYAHLASSHFPQLGPISPHDFTLTLKKAKCLEPHLGALLSHREKVSFSEYIPVLSYIIPKIHSLVLEDTNSYQTYARLTVSVVFIISWSSTEVI